MRQYRVLEGLFFNKEDRSLLRERIRNSSAGAGFAAALRKELAALDAEEYPPLRYDWYGYNESITQSTEPENYRNFHAHIGALTRGLARRTYLRTLALELLDQTEYKESIRADMLRIAKELPLHLFVMCDLGILYHSLLSSFLFVLDAERALFTEAEQFALDTFARGVTMDILANLYEWQHCAIGQNQHCNNHMVSHSQAAIEAGLYYHRADWVKYGLENPEGILVYLEDGMTDPGMGVEASLAYNLGSIWMLFETAATLRRAGHPLDLYRTENSRGGSLKSYFEAAFDYLTADGRIVPLGDNYAQPKWLCNMPVFFHACTVFGKEIPGLQWLAQHSATDTFDLYRLRMEPEAAAPLPEAVQTSATIRPDTRSHFFERFGAAVLKTVEGPDFWNSDAKTLAVRTGCGVIHGNRDHMAMLLFSGSNYLIRDFEGRNTLTGHAFSGHITRTLNRSRLAHSAVMIDGGDSLPMKGTYLACTRERGDGWQRITMEDAQRHLYPGVWMKRTLTLFHDRLEDVYEVDCGEAERDIDYIVHIGDSEHHPAFEKSPELLTKWFPAAYPSETLDWMRDVREIEAKGCIAAEHPGVKLTICADGGDKGLAFHLPEADDLSRAGSHSYLLRVHGSKAVFKAEYRF